MSYGQAGGYGQASGGHLLSAEALGKAKSLQFWLKLFGGFNLVFGGLYCLTIVGAIFGWFPVLLGWTLFQAGTKLDEFTKSNQVADLEGFIGQLRTHFFSLGLGVMIGFVIWLVMMVLYIALFGLVGLAAVAGAAQQ